MVLKASYSSSQSIKDALLDLNLKPIGSGVNIASTSHPSSGPVFESINPSNLETIASIQSSTIEDACRTIDLAYQSQQDWASLSPPYRGQILLEIRNELCEKKNSLAVLISAEVGKVYQEALGEVQEIIDICDYAIGLSRMLPGSIFPSERKGHILLETWRPIGLTGVITAFNFPAAVFGWNAALAWVCGNATIWKPAQSTSLVAIALNQIVERVLQLHGIDPSVSSLAIGDGSTIGQMIVDSEKVPLISFTGSTPVGRKIGMAVQSRFGRSILELGGNNAIIVMEDANIDLALRSVLFAAVGTTGQRCTSARRLMVHRSIYSDFTSKLIKAYQEIVVGDPLSPLSHCGPVHSKDAVQQYRQLIEVELPRQSGRIIGRAPLPADCMSKGNYVAPILVEIDSRAELVQKESFLPILYLFPFDSYQEAVQINNSVPQALSSSLFTQSMEYTMKWTSGPTSLFSSDCGIVNVNAPTNGAEIGGAFGGNKATGWGRESGSNSWQQYMTRHTCTINFSKELPLAQGIKFG